MRISAIVAIAENRAIGLNNQLPWHMPADLKHFKKITLGSPILMGRKTYESIGRPLPGRCNVVITRDADFVAPGCVVVNSIETALSSVGYSNEVFVIGGSALFQQMLPMIERLFLTVIHHAFHGDVFFPEINFNEWHEVSREDHEADEENKYSYSFIVLEKKVLAS